MSEHAHEHAHEGHDEHFTWQLAFFLVGSLFVFGMVACVAAWQIFATARARASAAREEAYQELASTSTGAMGSVNRQLERVNGELAELRARAKEMERILKEVG